MSQDTQTNIQNFTIHWKRIKYNLLFSIDKAPGNYVGAFYREQFDSAKNLKDFLEQLQSS